jgi:hypothetical protein
MFRLRLQLLIHAATGSVLHSSQLSRVGSRTVYLCVHQQRLGTIAVSYYPSVGVT